MTFSYFFFLLVIGCPLCWSQLSCRDPNGNPVDWFVVYKLPIIPKSTNPLIQTGLAYYYMDTDFDSFTLSPVSLKRPDQPVGYTLQQIYNSDRQKVFNMMYNDHPPANLKGNGGRGHTKGVIAFDTSYGFWLVHSVPRFPDGGQYSWPDSARKNGQTMLCITMKSSEFEKVGRQLMYNDPKVYSVNIPGNRFKEHFPNLSWLLAQRDRATLYSAGGREFYSFAKSSRAAIDLYQEVAPDLQTSLLVETWRTGSSSNLPSYCTGPYTVENVEVVKLNDVSFKYTKDHSKWAIGKTHDWVCIGDINRQVSQRNRGGGTVCLKDPQVWNSFHSAISRIDECPHQII